MGETNLASARARLRTPLRRALFLLFALLACTAHASSRSVGYLFRRLDAVAYHAVVADLNDPTVKVSPLLTVRYPGGAEPASDIIRRYWPTAAITGTYFCTISLRPIGDIVIDGRLRHFGGMGRALAITPTNDAVFLSVPFGRHVDWGGFESVIAAGPTLVRDGRIWLAPRAEGFTDPDVLGTARRCAVGLTPRHKLMLVATAARISLRQLARAMLRLGCRDAMALDGGASACLWYRGRYLVRPRRRLVDLLAVFEGVDPSKRTAARPGQVIIKWRAQQAWDLYQQAIAKPERAVDLLARACELDPANASYCVALASALERVGDTQAAAMALYDAARRYLRKGLIDRAESAVRRACDLWPTFADALMLRARIARMRGMLELASFYTQRARALFLLQQVPASSPDRLSALAKRLADLYGTPPTPVHMFAAVKANTASAGGIGLYVELPENWHWLPSPHANMLLAERSFMPWLVHIAAVGIPPAAVDDDICREYLRGTMLFLVADRPASLGAVPARLIEARGMAGDELARYRIVLAHRSGTLVIITFAAPERWWDIASPEFDAILHHSALALR